MTITLQYGAGGERQSSQTSLRTAFALRLVTSVKQNTNPKKLI